MPAVEGLLQRIAAIKQGAVPWAQVLHEALEGGPELRGRQADQGGQSLGDEGMQGRIDSQGARADARAGRRGGGRGHDTGLAWSAGENPGSWTNAGLKLDSGRGLSHSGNSLAASTGVRSAGSVA